MWFSVGDGFNAIYQLPFLSFGNFGAPKKVLFYLTREQTGQILRKENKKEAFEIQNGTGWGGRAAHDEEARRGR
jgi:hypothetical protein